MITVADIDRWTTIHQFCADDPGEIVSLDQARFALELHAGHDPHCQQYLAALRRTSEVCA
jgi:hypothetical protein